MSFCSSFSTSRRALPFSPFFPLQHNISHGHNIADLLLHECKRKKCEKHDLWCQMYEKNVTS